MTALLIGLVLLVAGIQILRWFARAEVKTVRKTINWGGLALIALVIGFLAATGRIGGAIAGLLALMAWAWRIMSMVHMGRQFSSMFRSFRFSHGGSAGTESSSGASEVDSVFLKMRLDHGTGAMGGEVKRGRFQGRRLADLALADLLLLLAEVQADPDSLGLLEAYLDRAHPDWREAAGAERGSQAPSPQTAMTAEEAYRILGISPGPGGTPPSTAEIKAAYRRLMGQLHPDHGGSDYLAAKVNQAKDFLLKKG